MTSETHLKKSDYSVTTIPLSLARTLVEKYHYARGGANTATYRHGLIRKDGTCVGVAWWIPPTKSAALATYPDDWEKVLSLSRFVIAPGEPTNAASFLLGRSMRMIDRERWRCLVTYADDWQGHSGTIYRATNWTYAGKTKPEPTYLLDGVMVSRKAGPKTRTRAEMEAMGCVMIGRFAKHKYVLITTGRPSPEG